jgi:hypothetical protein
MILPRISQDAFFIVAFLNNFFIILKSFYFTCGKPANQSILRHVFIHESASGNDSTAGNGNASQNGASDTDPTTVSNRDILGNPFTRSSFRSSDLMTARLKNDVRRNVALIPYRNRSISVDLQISANPTIFSDDHFSAAIDRSYNLCSFADAMSDRIQ